MDHLSIYLDVADSATLPYGWNRFAHFSLAIVNQYDHKLTVKKGNTSCTLLLSHLQRISLFSCFDHACLLEVFSSGQLIPANLIII